MPDTCETPCSRVQEASMYCFALIAFQFYSYVGLSNTMRKLPIFCLIVLMFIVCARVLAARRAPMVFNMLRYILFVTLIAMGMAWLTWGQDIVLSYRIMAYMFVFIFFFYLFVINPSLKQLERFIWVLAIVYVVLWLYAWTQLPTRVFGISDEDELLDTSRGMERINFCGRLSLILGHFLAVNKFYQTRKKLYIVIAVTFFVFNVLQLTRQLILWTGLVTLFYVWLKSRGTFVTVCCLVGAILLMGVSVVKIPEDSIVGALLAQTEKQVEANASGREDIRITEYKKYWFDWNHDPLSIAFGSGMPHADSAYGRYNLRMQLQEHLYLSDVGYGKMVAATGWVGLLLYLWFFFLCLIVPVPPHLHYAKMFILFLVPANIAASWYSGADCQIAMSICAYLLCRYRLSNHFYVTDIFRIFSPRREQIE